MFLCVIIVADVVVIVVDVVVVVVLCCVVLCCVVLLFVFRLVADFGEESFAKAKAEVREYLKPAGAKDTNVSVLAGSLAL